MAESLAVIPDYTGGAKMRGRCLTELHLINPTTCEENGDKSPEFNSCHPVRHSPVLPDDTESLKEETKDLNTKTFAPSDFSKSEKSSKPEIDLDDIPVEPLIETQRSEAPVESTDLRPHKRIRMDRATIRWLGILPEDIVRWKETFPSVEVEQQLRKMEVWVSANPAQWKSNWLRFIVRWLSREQDKGGSHGNGNRRTYDEKRSDNIDRFLRFGESPAHKNASGPDVLDLE